MNTTVEYDSLHWTYTDTLAQHHANKEILGCCSCGGPSLQGRLTSTHIFCLSTVCNTGCYRAILILTMWLNLFNVKLLVSSRFVFDLCHTAACTRVGGCRAPPMSQGIGLCTQHTHQPFIRLEHFVPTFSVIRTPPHPSMSASC